MRGRIRRGFRVTCTLNRLDSSLLFSSHQNIIRCGGFKTSIARAIVVRDPWCTYHVTDIGHTIRFDRSLAIGRINDGKYLSEEITLFAVRADRKKIFDGHKKREEKRVSTCVGLMNVCDFICQLARTR